MHTFKDTTKSCCFSGHRTVDFNMSESKTLKQALSGAICKAINDGFRIFYGGMAHGFDILAAEETIRQRYARQDVELRYISVLPYNGHEMKTGQDWKKRHKDVLYASDDIITLSEKYHKGCFHVRNQFLIERSTRLIALFNGKPGGTKFTFNLAVSNNIEIINLWNENMGGKTPLPPVT